LGFIGWCVMWLRSTIGGSFQLAEPAQPEKPFLELVIIL
jgi:hypothetical protein